MSSKRSASDGLRFAMHLWHTERNARYARRVLDDLLANHPDSDEAIAASNLLAEINNGAMPQEDLDGKVSSKLKTAGHVAAALMALAGIGLIIFGMGLIDSAPSGDGGIYGLFGILIILAGGLMTIAVVVSWIFNAVAQQYGIKGIIALVSIVLAFGYLIF